MASDVGLDLVEVSPNAEPPVCKIMDFGKFQYEQKKQTNEAKKKQKKTQVKTIKYRPGTEEGDYQIKFRNLVKFLENGDKLKLAFGSVVEKCSTENWAWKCWIELKRIVKNLPMLNRRQKWRVVS